MSKFPESFFEGARRLVETDASVMHDHLSGLTESPIETMFAVALCMAGKLCYGDVAIVPHPKEPSAPNPYEFVLQPQFKVLKYRIDFLVCVNSRFDTSRVLVECDGHNYHERTKEQAARDRAKDRELQSAGFRVFRFTGHEIYRDAFKCASDVLFDLSCQEGEAYLRERGEWPS